MRSSKPVLLAEDDLVDTLTVRRALGDLNVPYKLVHAADGQEALEYLRNESNEKPYIILLDLNMPRMNGLEFLKILKADDTLKRIPVVALTTSTKEEDIAQSFELSVAGYIVKPIGYKEFQQAISTIESYWTLSELPDAG
jgi:CheY-like chemotaxis protein